MHTVLESIGEVATHHAAGFAKGKALYSDGIPLCISGCLAQADFEEKRGNKSQAEYYQGMVDGFKYGYPDNNPVQPTGECRQVTACVPCRHCGQCANSKR